MSSFFVAVVLDGDGAHPAAWRAADHRPDTLLSPERILSQVAEAERYGFDLIQFTDRQVPDQGTDGIVGQLDAVSLGAYVGPTTSTIGIAVGAQVLDPEPFHLAAQFASLDHASLGRAAWIVRADNDPLVAAAYGHPERDAEWVAVEVGEVIEAVRLLWDSWEDGTVIRDSASGRYIDGDKLHHIDFVGEHFSVRGPLITPRPTQGQPVVLADTSLLQQALAAREASGRVSRIDGPLVDVALVTGTNRVAVHEQAAAARDLGAPLVFVEVEVVLDTDTGTAAERLSRLDADEPWGTGTRLRVVGSASEVSDALAGLAEVVDGVLLHPAVLDADLPELGRLVLPDLARRSVRQIPAVPGQDGAAAATTLRERLGLPRPANVFAA